MNFVHKEKLCFLSSYSACLQSGGAACLLPLEPTPLPPRAAGARRRQPPPLTVPAGSSTIAGGSVALVKWQAALASQLMETHLPSTQGNVCFCLNNQLSYSFRDMQRRKSLEYALGPYAQAAPRPNGCHEKLQGAAGPSILLARPYSRHHKPEKKQAHPKRCPTRPKTAA
jgi:hypothetical protein